MTAIVLAAGVSNLLSEDTIYTLKLRRRGIDILRGRAANVMQILHVADAMVPVPTPAPQHSPLNEVIARFAAEGLDGLPVVDARGEYRGTVTSAELERSAQENLLDATAGDLARTTPVLREDQTLEEALGVLVTNERSGLPVLSADGGRVSGWMTHRDVLRAYNDRLHTSVAAAEATTTFTPPETPAPRPAPRPAPEPPRAAAAQVAAQRSLARLQGYRILDLELGQDGPPVGQRVAGLRLPPSSLLLAVRRAGSSFTADADTVLRRGDRLSLLVPAEHAERVTALVEELATGPGAEPGDPGQPTGGDVGRRPGGGDGAAGSGPRSRLAADNPTPTDPAPG
jgi:CIC family chloride channel protein